MVIWDSAADWDAYQSQEGTAHESAPNTPRSDASELRHGYAWTDPILPSGLSHYHPLTETSGDAIDYAGSVDGSLIDGVTRGVAGPLDAYAMRFDGSSGYVDVDGTFDAAMPDEWAVLAWIKTNVSSPSERKTVIGGRVTIDDYMLIRQETDGSIVLSYSIDGSGGVLTGPTLATDTPYHVGGAMTSSNVYLFLDGVQEDSTSESRSWSVSGGNTHIGNWAGGNRWYWDGDIAEVRQYLGNPLSQSQAQTHRDVIDSGTLTAAAKTLQ